MLKQHSQAQAYPYPHHEPGEVVLVSFGNFLENRGGCSKKSRPAILLGVSHCQHTFAGLTTKPRYRTSGDPRPAIPLSGTLGLDGKASYLWSSRVAFVARLDVRRHLGWVDHAVVEFLAEHMQLDTITFSKLWRAASSRVYDVPRQPR